MVGEIDLAFPLHLRNPCTNVLAMDNAEAEKHHDSGVPRPVMRICTVLGLNRTELARLFGVRRQAVDQWGVHGVPADRQEKLATLGAIADLLEAKLKPDRIPGVVRRAAPAYGERSLLEAIADGDQDAVLDELRDAFEWASAA